MIEITLLENGPAFIPGPAKVQLDDQEEGVVFPTGVALCRCGNSTNLPLCSGKHEEKGFYCPGGTIEVAKET
jgi:CDGSH-type Zn-finger protein